MEVYKKMYLHLFNRVTDALDELEKDSVVAEKLRNAQCECEAIFIEYCGETPTGEK